MSERYYTLSTNTIDEFNELHNELLDGSILSRVVDCENHTEHSPTRGEYLVTDDEAETLGADARVLFINLTPARYPEIFNATEDDLRMDVKNESYDRYASTVRNWQEAFSGSFSQDTAADVGRATNQLIRMEQKRNPWVEGSISSTTKIDRNPRPKGAGEGVDIICMDNGTWIGHVEFINPQSKL